MTVDQFVNEAPQYLQVAGMVIGAAAAVAAFTPTPADDGILLVLRKIIDFLALNFKNAKNEKAS